MQCIYGYSASYSFPQIQPITQLKLQCSFKISETANPAPYLSLQICLESYEHSQNEVIANQNHCHEDLFLEEFIAFGSMRGGHRIQLRNLYRAISSRLLSFEEEPVLALILQSIWQVGPGEAREAHMDFEDVEFSSAFLEVLEGLVKENETNYNQPLILLTAVVITVRIMELNENMDERCYSLLKRWRLVIKRWTKTLETEMARDLDPPTLTELQKTLLQTRICSALSYNFSTSAGFQKVMRDEEDIVEGFHTVCIINQEDQEGCLSNFMELLLSVAKNVPLRFELKSQVESNSVLDASLRRFVLEKRCSASLNLTLEPDFEAHDNIIVLKCWEETGEEEPCQCFWITFDFILGTFLVNGLEDGQLDPSITETAAFRRYFLRDSTHFRVQKESENVFRTVTKFHGRLYQFQRTQEEVVVAESGNLESVGGVRIKEIGEDGSVLTLLEHENFRNQFNPSLVDNYTHWFDEKNGLLYFRRRPTQDEDYELPHEYKLIAVVGQDQVWHLFDEKRGAFLLNVGSVGYRELVGAFLGRFELKHNVDVLLDKEREVVTVHLPRYGLRFTVSQEGKLLECMEYPGFHLSVEDKEGVLLGLEQGIKLKSEHKRLLLLPNGDIHHDMESGAHRQVVQINLGKLRQPPYFVYEFDQVLGRLVANKSKPAWLYLAALHAVTSSSLPDPFTGVTGTEMAVRILQSGFIWSSSPYDGDSLRSLKFIRGLSPKRSYYGVHHVGAEGAIEVIEWPPGLPSMAAYDGFEIIVDKLIEDSGRLEELYCVDSSKQVNQELACAKLRLQGYFRHLRSYNQAAAVEKSYFRQDLATLSDWKSSENIITPSKSSEFYRSAAIQLACCRLPGWGRSQSFESREYYHYQLGGTDLFYLLPTRSPSRAASKASHLGPVQDLFKLELRYSSWLTLYGMAIEKGKSDEDKQRFTMILCGMAYSYNSQSPGNQTNQLLKLHYISEFADEVEFPPVSPGLPGKAHSGSPYPAKEEVTAELVNILMRLDENKRGDHAVEDPLIREAANSIAASLTERFWRCESIPETEDDVRSTLARFDWKGQSALRDINWQMHSWFDKAEKYLFAEDVQNKLNEIFKSIDHLPDHQLRTIHPNSAVAVAVAAAEKAEWSCDIRLDDFLEQTSRVGGTGGSRWELARGHFEAVDRHRRRRKGSGKEAFLWEKTYHSSKARTISGDLSRSINDSVEGRIVYLSGLCQRLDPTTLLRTLTTDDNGKLKASHSNTAALTLGVLWTHIKRSNRCLLYIARNQTAELERELGNGGHANWSPQAYPEWVLLELELDIMIRPVQVEVAKQMMNMPDHGGNGIMQLNMGEGKTSVIVPMLCSTLSRKGEQLCRVTVLGSIFNMNYATLSFAIGGLLNRRVYSVPCKRDVAIDENLVERIQSVYKECLEMKGTVVTLPEHRLSFRLLAYDKILRQEVELGLKLHQTENWLRENVRDVMDEADELLNVKYQLIYTIGGQAPLDGGDLRWTTCQRLLKIVQRVGEQLSKKYGANDLEFDSGQLEAKPHQFAPIRLLDAKMSQEFVSAVADHFLEELILTKQERTQIGRFLTQKEIGEEDLKGILAICEDSGILTHVLIASGYLRRGVLALGLSKRWRVEYGVDATKSFRLMAVPFRAKDVAAERTEFGHPDLAILLTQLSYYYSGLSRPELKFVFKLMKSLKEADGLYRSWIQQIPNEQVPGSLTTLRGINFKDASQISELFKLLNKHKSVIDFWLSNKVFPKESKEFPAKLVMTAWDLCYERQKHPITGFSGTNDSSVLLPLPITQQDLPKLLDTNKKVEAILLQPENHGHRKLEMGVSCKEILEMMKEDALTVLIDAGALMLECSNEQLASVWLEVNSELEAALYFNDHNELVVKARSSSGESHAKDVPLELSSFKGRLEKCGVFLDDQHTRGTDIKFPVGARACVTVGGKMKRDKLIQACMRMRKLGFGQSVTFYLSHEASGRIMASKQDKIEIQTKAVLEWVSSNTKTFNEDGLLYWAASGRNYAQRLAAEDYFGVTGNGNLLGEQCKDLEVLQLLDLYGRHVDADLLTSVIPLRFHKTMTMLRTMSSRQPIPIPSSLWKEFCRIRDQIVERCRLHIPTKIQYFSSDMEEEQERELEPEKEKEMEAEEETQVERVTAHPAPHDLHETVVKVVRHGMEAGVRDIPPGIQRLCDIFEETSFWKEVMPEGWGQEVFVTTDFITVISDEGLQTDSYLRPIEYVVSEKAKKSGSAPKLLLLSPFEVNELLPWFRTEEVATQLHMFSPRKSEKQDLLLNDGRLVLPKKGCPVNIPENSRSVAALLLASGNLYFRTMEEQRAFALFASLAPQPWTEEEKEAFDSGLITKSVFMMPQYRVGGGVGERPFAFCRDPSALIRKIVMARHAVVSDMAHVIRLLNEKVYVDLDRPAK